MGVVTVDRTVSFYLGPFSMLSAGSNTYIYIYIYRFIRFCTLPTYNKSVKYCLSVNIKCAVTTHSLGYVTLCVLLFQVTTHWVAQKLGLTAYNFNFNFNILQHTTGRCHYNESYTAIPVPPSFLPRCILRRYFQETTQVRCQDLLRTHSLLGVSNVPSMGNLENNLYVIIYNTAWICPLQKINSVLNKILDIYMDMKYVFVLKFEITP